MAEDNTKNRKSHTVAKIISFVLILLLLIGIIGIVFVFTNGGNEDFKTFYLVYNGENILTAESKKDLMVGKEHRFDVKYTFDVGKEEPRDYNVKIVANTDYDFDYTVDDTRMTWKGEKEITKAFDLKKESTFFTLTLPEDLTTKDVLKNLYEGKAVVLDPAKEEELKASYLYTLVVSSYNDAVVYYIHFRLPSGNFADVTLDFDHFCF